MATSVQEYRPPSGTCSVGDKVHCIAFGEWTIIEILEVLPNGFLVRMERPDPEPCDRPLCLSW